LVTICIAQEVADEKQKQKVASVPSAASGQNSKSMTKREAVARHWHDVNNNGKLTNTKGKT
jgi:hypothetical protein